MGDKSLYDRLGGVFAIAAVINRFSDEVVKNRVAGQGSDNPALKEWHTQQLARLPGLKFMRTLWVCDVAGGPNEVPDRVPGLLECMVGAAQISMQSVIREKLKWHQPDVLVRPQISGVFIMDFLKTQAILDMNVGFKDDLKRRLEHVINTPFELPALLPPVTEEAAQKVRRRRLADTGVNLWRMVAGGRAKEANPVLDRAALEVGSAVIEPADAGEGNGRRA